MIDSLPPSSPTAQSPTSDTKSFLSRSLEKIHMDHDSDGEEFDARGFAKISEEICTGTQVKWVAGSVAGHLCISTGHDRCILSPDSANALW